PWPSFSSIPCGPGCRSTRPTTTGTCGSTPGSDMLADVAANPGVKLGVLLVATLGLSYLANYWLSRLFPGKLYRYLVAPGVIVHEYSHAVGCLVTGTPVREVRVFDPSGGKVTHEAPRFPL